MKHYYWKAEGHSRVVEEIHVAKDLGILRSRCCTCPKWLILHWPPQGLCQHASGKACWTQRLNARDHLARSCMQVRTSCVPNSRSYAVGTLLVQCHAHGVQGCIPDTEGPTLRGSMR